LKFGFGEELEKRRCFPGESQSETEEERREKESCLVTGQQMSSTPGGVNGQEGGDIATEGEMVPGDGRDCGRRKSSTNSASSAPTAVSVLYCTCLLIIH
jgi:hypothetical protein